MEAILAKLKSVKPQARPISTNTCVLTGPCVYPYSSRGVHTGFPAATEYEDSALRRSRVFLGDDPGGFGTKSLQHPLGSTSASSMDKIGFLQRQTCYIDWKGVVSG